jgi:hypothetical protein
MLGRLKNDLNQRDGKNVEGSVTKRTRWEALPLATACGYVVHSGEFNELNRCESTIGEIVAN